MLDQVRRLVSLWCDLPRRTRATRANRGRPHHVPGSMPPQFPRRRPTNEPMPYAKVVSVLRGSAVLRGQLPILLPPRACSWPKPRFVELVTKTDWRRNYSPEMAPCSTPRALPTWVLGEVVRSPLAPSPWNRVVIGGPFFDEQSATMKIAAPQVPPPDRWRWASRLRGDLNSSSCLGAVETSLAIRAALLAPDSPPPCVAHESGRSRSAGQDQRS